MANKVTTDDVKVINELYYKFKSYAEVARQTGFTAATVKKYVVKDWKPVEEDNIRRFDMAKDMPIIFGTYLFRGVDNYGELCILTPEEKEEIYELQKEVSV